MEGGALPGLLRGARPLAQDIFPSTIYNLSWRLTYQLGILHYNTGGHPPSVAGHFSPLPRSCFFLHPCIDLRTPARSQPRAAAKYLSKKTGV
jgi:hypothetical protein